QERQTPRPRLQPPKRGDQLIVYPRPLKQAPIARLYDSVDTDVVYSLMLSGSNPLWFIAQRRHSCLSRACCASACPLAGSAITSRLAVAAPRAPSAPGGAP